MKLDVVKFGWACAILWGACVLSMGIMSGFVNWGTPLVKGLSSLYIGYNTTPAGIIIGTIWALLDAGIGGCLLAWIYNKLVG